MKKFIATITYGTNTRVKGSRIVQVQASTKAVAEKRARKYAVTEYTVKYSLAEKYLDVVVEELTPAKAAALEEKYDELAAMVEALTNYDSAVKGYARI